MSPPRPRSALLDAARGLLAEPPSPPRVRSRTLLLRAGLMVAAAGAVCAVVVLDAGPSRSREPPPAGVRAPVSRPG